MCVNEERQFKTIYCGFTLVYPKIKNKNKLLGNICAFLLLFFLTFEGGGFLPIFLLVIVQYLVPLPTSDRTTICCCDIRCDIISSESKMHEVNCTTPVLYNWNILMQPSKGLSGSRKMKNTF